MATYGWKVNIWDTCYRDNKFTHHTQRAVVINNHNKKELEKELYPELKPAVKFQLGDSVITSSGEFIYSIESLGKS